jgi:pimeloyl-ACP methyl ester carboxylesterase
MTFTDQARNNRQVPAEIYYPAQTAGNNTPVASGTFPVIVFGHGFLMSYSAYAYFQSAIVPEGYFVVFAATEGSISPNHLNFGLDLAFLITAMQGEGNNPASPFFQHVDSTSAVMGHSMGGGASFLGCENNRLPTAMVTFAAAETNPSAIAAAKDITIPSLVFAASEDCVTPPLFNQIPMYDSLASNCKVYLDITGGGHCYFADYNFQCSLGEIGCQQNFTITREEQHDIILDFTKPFLDFFLKKNTAAWVLFNDSLAASQRITYQKSCTTTGSSGNQLKQDFRIGPNPAEDFITIEGSFPEDEEQLAVVADYLGRVHLSARIKKSEFPFTMNISSLPSGFWIVSMTGRGKVCILKMVRK